MPVLVDGPKMGGNVRDWRARPFAEVLTQGSGVTLLRSKNFRTPGIATATPRRCGAIPELEPIGRWNEEAVHAGVEAGRRWPINRQGASRRRGRGAARGLVASLVRVGSRVLEARYRIHGPDARAALLDVRQSTSCRESAGALEGPPGAWRPPRRNGRGGAGERVPSGSVQCRRERGQFAQRPDAQEWLPERTTNSQGVVEGPILTGRSKCS